MGLDFLERNRLGMFVLIDRIWLDKPEKGNRGVEFHGYPDSVVGRDLVGFFSRYGLV